MKKKIKIGSRGSKLALLYAQKVKDKIIEVTNFDNEDIFIEKISTKGDEIQDMRLSEVGGKGLFLSSSPLIPFPLLSLVRFTFGMMTSVILFHSYPSRVSIGVSACHSG